MSDFLFSSKSLPYGALTESLNSIYLNNVREIHSCEYHGEWGSLAVTSSYYRGFQPVETESHICVVIGGPVLYFQSNEFLGEEDPQAGTRGILEHWHTGKVDWSEDLSGPFVVLIIDKQTSKVACITDLLMFVPVYQYCDIGSIYWGTHIDALAHVCGKQRAFDEVSLVDFVLHNAVTYPYTAYKDIRQCQPGSTHCWRGDREGKAEKLNKATYYWRPLECNSYASLDEAARSLREGVQGYIDRITDPLSRVAQFVSAGEDSRALAGMLPQRLDRDAYIFLDGMNREGKVAKKVAKIYQAHFKPTYRSQTYYLDILPEASRLVGTGHQYIHAHTVGFDKQLGLGDYHAVFGGYISDSLLKGQYANKPKWMGRFPFFPHFVVKGERRTKSISHELFTLEVLHEITRRRREHFSRVELIRPNSAHEWFELWPATMRVTMPNLYSNRRLFASYEVFMAKESIKIAASVPVRWKLNRQLFNRAFKPALEKSKFLFHADGRLPYYPWWVNLAIQFPIWFFQQIEKIVRIVGVYKKNQGAWADWRSLMSSKRWDEEVNLYVNDKVLSKTTVHLKPPLLRENSISRTSKVNLLQVFFNIRNFSSFRTDTIASKEKACLYRKTKRETK